MRGLRKTVFYLVAAVFFIWVYSHYRMIAGDENGTARFVLGTLFAWIILARRKNSDQDSCQPGWTVPATAVAGTVLVVGGIIFDIGQFEWLGLIVLFYSCLSWAFSRRYTRDIVQALFVLYWIHPLPGKLFLKFQMLMQVLSVKGAEWLLHCFNVRVWADGIVLNTGFQAFLVPDSCSGMVTAVTVLVTALGIGMLFRFRWFEVGLLLMAGVVQVLALNILRIFFMVVWSARMSPEWANTFLHDTLGILLLAAILLVQLEAVFWRTSKAMKKEVNEGIEAGDVEEPELATILPRFWRLLSEWKWIGLAVLLLAGTLAVALYKHRPSHRAVMISDVVEGLMLRDLAKAERAIDQALGLKPGDRDFISKRIHVMVLRGKYNEALAELNSAGGPRDTTEMVLKSFALMSLKQADAAIALVDSLSESEKNMPGVAMIRAEYAVGRNKPSVVASCVVQASSAPLLIHRVRALFPYLAAHRQWWAISASYNESVPYKECSQPLIEIYANLELNNVYRASKILKAALASWPNDPRFVGSLFMVAARRPGSEWENLFAENIMANIKHFDADRLGSYMEYCFKLSRPDLAWLLYLRLRTVDPGDPALYLVPAQFGNVWFSFRCHQLGIAAANSSIKIDMKPFYVLTKDTSLMRSFWENVPLAEELAGKSVEGKRIEYLARCIAELEKREKAGTINRRMYMTYPTALTMAGRYKDAETVLRKLISEYPDAERELIYQRAVLYDQQGKLQDCYETLVKYRALSGGSYNLNVDLMMVNMLINLNMGVCALEVAERARESFPDSSLACMALAAVWDVFGFKDQALFLLSRKGDDQCNARAVAQLLYETGCFKEAEKLSRAMGFGISRKQVVVKQGFLAPPAELSIAGKWPRPLLPEEMDREAERTERELSQSSSPFFKQLKRLSAEWYRARGRGAVSDTGRWAAIGRDNIEKAGALYQLAMLQARQKLYDQAAKSTEEAIVFMPKSAVFWRALIAMKQGSPDIIDSARRACPSDPDIWLAYLVTGIKRNGNKKWLDEEIEKAAAQVKFSPGTMVRAGNLLLRKGFTGQAGAAARNAIDRCRGALPAYVLGLQCALTAGDTKWALSCVRGCIENALDPRMFYSLMVDIKSVDKMTDADVIAALEYLKEHSPKETQWTERLGDAYFLKGDLERADSILDELTAGNFRGLKVRSLLLAGETARLEEDYTRAIKILENAYAAHPDMVSVLNNLVYNLARNGDNAANLKRASELLVKLLEVDGESAFVLDTAAVVYMKTGELEKARKYSEKARSLVRKNSYAAVEMELNAAEIMLRMGETGAARDMLKKLQHGPDRSQFIDSRIVELLRNIADRSEKK